MSITEKNLNKKLNLIFNRNRPEVVFTFFESINILEKNIQKSSKSFKSISKLKFQFKLI